MRSWSGAALNDFEVEQVLGAQLAAPGLRRRAENDLLRLPARHGEAHAMTNHAEIVFELGFQLELFHRRDPNVVRRLRHLDDRRLVPRDVRHDLGGQLVGTPFLVDQLDAEPPRVGEFQGGAVDVVAVLVRRQLDRLAILVDQLGRGDVFVEAEEQRQLGPLHRGDVANVLDGLGLERRIARENQLGVGAL